MPQDGPDEWVELLLGREWAEKVAFRVEHHREEWAALRPRAETFSLVGLAWEVFAVPHLVFHAAHLNVYEVGDRVGNVIALGGTVALAAVLLVPERSPAARRRAG